MDEFTEEQLEYVEEVEPSLGVAKGFFRKLLNSEDDWSFVIKTHALIESTLTRLIQVTVQPQPLAEFIATLDVSGGRHSKVMLLRKCKLLENDEEKFVRGLSKIRNQLVHNVRHTNFGLKKYVEDLDDNQKNEFLSNSCGIFTDHEDAAKAAEHRAGALARPRAYIWACALHVAAVAALRTRNAELAAETEALQKESLERQLAALKEFAANTARFPFSKVDGLAIYKKLLTEREKPEANRKARDANS
jgi:hypothetical protein